MQIWNIILYEYLYNCIRLIKNLEGGGMKKEGKSPRNPVKLVYTEI